MRTGSRRHRISTVFQILGRRAGSLRIGLYTIFLDTTCALVGENGAGKSTLIDILLGLFKATKGSISFFGESGRTGLARARRNIGFVPDGCGAFLNLTGRENLISRCIEWGLPKSEVNRVLAAVGLENAADASVKQYSLGMKRRLDIGTALLGNPQLLIMDEPINGLDPVGVIEVRDLLLSLKDKRDKTVLISSHNLDELEKVATSFAFLHQGRLLVKEENSYKDRSLEKRFLDLIGEADNATSATD